MSRRKSKEPRIVSAWGESKTVAQWICDPRCVVDMSTLYTRLRSGKSGEDAISEPPQQRRWIEPLEKPVTNKTPPVTYGNYSMPRASLSMKFSEPARGAAAMHAYSLPSGRKD